MFSCFSLSKLKMMPPAISPAMSSSRMAGWNQPIIMATWYRANIRLLKQYAKPRVADCFRLENRNPRKKNSSNRELITEMYREK